MSQRGLKPSDRRAFLKGTGALAAVSIAGCLGDDDDDPPADDTADDADPEEDNQLRFILNPAEPGVDMHEQYEPLFTLIEDNTDAEIDASVTESYTATVDAIRAGLGEMADISPTGVVAAPDEMDIVGIRVAFGAAVYFSTITTTYDSPIDDLTDLEEEHEVALVDPLSVSGGLFPLFMIMDAGVDIGDAPDGDPVDFHATYSGHDVAIQELIRNDDVVAAGTGAFVSAQHLTEDQMSEDFMEMSAEVGNLGTADEELQLLAVSDPIPRAPIVARSDWDAAVRPDVEEVLLNATEDDLIDEDKDDDHQLWFTNIVEGTIDDYQPIVDVMDALDLEMADLE